MKKIVIYMVAILAAVGTFMSCGPMKATSTSNVRTQFTSDPSGATVMYDGKVIGTTPCIVSMPLKATAVNKGSMFKPNIVTTVDQWEFQFAKDGITETVAVDPSTVLVENGAIPIHYTFKQYRQDPTIVSGEASNMVSVEHGQPGQTGADGTRTHRDPLVFRFRPARCAHLLACGVEHPVRSQEHQRDLSDDDAL